MATNDLLDTNNNEKMMSEIAVRLADVRSQIAETAQLAGRDPEDITLVGVSKRFPAEAAMAAVRLGLEDLGENRVQELGGKICRLDEENLHPRWHLIGTLQKNKVRHVVGKVHLIHSVDSYALIEEISKRSTGQKVLTRLLLQVNTSGELSKHGFDPDYLEEAALRAEDLPGIKLCGLMTMAPLSEDPDSTLPIFEKTREAFNLLSKRLNDPTDWNTLSMGMSGDYRQAIRCGSTLVRIGTAIFGRRL